MPSAAVGKAPATGKAVDSTAAKRLVQEDSYRQEAKAAFEAHTHSTAGKDILERCKRLNEFLESDFLKGGKPQSKEQLREILGILNAGPKRPSFLDKPPVTAAAVKTQPGKQSLDADKILSALDCEPDPGPTTRSSLPASSPSGGAQEPEDLDDLIGLLNGGSSEVSKPPSVSAREREEAEERERKLRHEEEVRQRALEEEQRAKAQAEEQERRRCEEEKAKARQREEEERRRRAQEELRQRQQQEAEEAARIKREREEAERKCREEEAARRRREEAERQSKLEQEQRRREEEDRRRREEEEQRQRLEAERAAAAVALQCVIRMRLARRKAAALRAELSAALNLQSAVRARAGRRMLQGLQVEAFRRRHAARCIASYYKAYKSRWHLGPVRVRTGSCTGAVPMDGHAHLLALPLRLRSTADTRLAPDAGGSGASSPSAAVAAEATASGRRTALTVRQRVGDVAKQEGQTRSDMGVRAVMAGSEHRDFHEAMQAVKGAGAAGASLPAARPSPTGKPPAPSGSLSGSGRVSGGARPAGVGGGASAGGGSKPPTAGSLPGSKPTTPGSLPGSKPASPGGLLGSRPPSRASSRPPSNEGSPGVKRRSSLTSG